MEDNKPVIAISILTANFLNLEEQLKEITNAKINHIHYDVMDYHFVNNLTFGTKILTDINKFTKEKNIKIDCHLMVKIKKDISVEQYLTPYIENEVNSITLHYEALTKKQLQAFLSLNHNFKKGIAINPETKVKAITHLLDKIDYIMVMSVNPGFGKQKFIEASINKIQEIKAYIKANNLTTIISVDGGINDITGKKCIKAGANYLVSGSYLVNSSNSIALQVEKILK